MISLITTMVMCLFANTMSYAATELRQGPQLIFASAIEVSPRQKMTLFDIVETRGASPELIESLKTKTIEHTDNEITRDDLVRALRGISAHFLLPQEIKLIRSKQKVSRMELERKIKNQLLARCSDCEFQIQVQSVPQTMTAEWDLELNIDLTKETVMIPITDDSQKDTQKGNQWAIVEIRKYAEVPVSARNIASQTSIEPAMFKLEKRLVRSAVDMVTTADELDGVLTTKAMSSGQTFSKRDLKKEQIIKKNQIVKAQVDRDGYQIFITAVAEDSGAMGDLIRVKNLDSQKTIAAEIVGRGVVKID